MKICPKTIKLEEYKNGYWCYYTSIKRPITAEHAESLRTKYGLTTEVTETLYATNS